MENTALISDKYFNILGSYICNLYNNQIELFSKLHNQFMRFDFPDRRDLLLYSSYGIIYKPNCIKITNIRIITDSTTCYTDLPIEIELNNITKKVFYTSDNILMDTSIQVNCSTLSKYVLIGESIFFREGKRATKLLSTIDKPSLNYRTLIGNDLLFHDPFSHYNYISKTINILQELHLTSMTDTRATSYSERDSLDDSAFNLNFIIDKIHNYTKVVYGIGILVVSMIIIYFGGRIILIVRIIFNYCYKFCFCFYGNKQALNQTEPENLNLNIHQAKIHSKHNSIVFNKNDTFIEHQSEFQRLNDIKGELTNAIELANTSSL
jgi:hypothetical protein